MVLIYSLGLVTMAHANLLAGGDFEEPQFDNSSHYNLFSDASVPGWLSFSGQIEIQEDDFYNGFSAADGTQWANLDTQGINSIFQFIALEQYSEYQIGFSFAPEPFASGKDRQQLRVGILFPGEEGLYYSYDAVQRDWDERLIRFTAESDVAFIFFKDLADTDGRSTLLDAVSLKMVPISGTLWLLASGLIGLLVVRRRTRT